LEKGVYNASMKNDKELNMIEDYRIFTNGPTKVTNAVREAAEWICEDWPEGAGFGSSDRASVYHLAMRYILGNENYKLWSHGALKINPTEYSMFTEFANNCISEELHKAEERYGY